MITTVSVAARPGVFSGFFVSSFIVRVTSHPQKMKIDSDRPATTAVKAPTAKGLNHESSTGLASNALPCATCTKAATEKITRTSTWKVTRTYCSFCVVCMSRYEIRVAPSMNSRHTSDVDERVEGELGDRAGAAGDLIDQEEEELDRDAGEIRQHEDGRGDQSPAGHPADPGPERARRPRERGARVGHRRLSSR